MRGREKGVGGRGGGNGGSGEKGVGRGGGRGGGSRRIQISRSPALCGVGEGKGKVLVGVFNAPPCPPPPRNPQQTPPRLLHAAVSPLPPTVRRHPFCYPTSPPSPSACEPHLPSSFTPPPCPPSFPPCPLPAAPLPHALLTSCTAKSSKAAAMDRRDNENESG